MSEDMSEDSKLSENMSEESRPNKNTSEESKLIFRLAGMYGIKMFHVIDKVPDLTKSFHFCEEYDKNREYQKENYEYDYGHGLRKYKNEVYRFCFDTGESVYYIVAMEQLSYEEMKRLEPYCQCKYHTTSSWLHPYSKLSMMFTRPGCLGEMNPSQNVIDKTKEYMAHHGLVYKDTSL